MSEVKNVLAFTRVANIAHKIYCDIYTYTVAHAHAHAHHNILMGQLIHHPIAAKAATITGSNNIYLCTVLPKFLVCFMTTDHCLLVVY